MKSTISKYDERIQVSDDQRYGIQKYDIDNAYPQRIKIISESSGITSICQKFFAKYVRGQGFQEITYYSAICNRSNWTFDKLLRKVAEDYAIFGGFAIHVNYNALLQISEMNYVPFENVRLAIADDTGYVGKVKLHNDWGKKLKGKRFDEKDIVELDVYNPKQEVVLAQIEKAEGIENYKGQIFYYNGDSEGYPASPIDSVYEDVETDGELKYYNHSQVMSGFMAHIAWITKGKFEKPKDEEEFENNLKDFQGVRAGGKILHIQVDNDEEIPDIKPIQTNIDDRLFAYTALTVRESIIRQYMIPTILLGISTPNALGDKNDREGAKNVYSDITKEDRILMEAVFGALFEHWHRQEDNPTRNFTITQISGVSTSVNVELYKDMTVNERRQMILNLPPQQEQQAASKLLVEVLGVGGTQALQMILVDPTLTTNQKKATLMLVFGFTEADAIKLVTKDEAIN